MGVDWSAAESASAASKCLPISARMRARSQVWMSAPGAAAVCVRWWKRQRLCWKYCQYQWPSSASITGFIAAGALASSASRRVIFSSGLLPSIRPSRAILRPMARTASA
ncbi:MAG: hypothetical protein BWX86_01432 [Verrucomicrobia bacterium ADurb.Bin122]|nr:MAG: hypothetical protein BWX86_01432 [Verrucomicrobia bacterium ADurb.Bin122]